jgi:hypothetical protein
MWNITGHIGLLKICNGLFRPPRLEREDITPAAALRRCPTARGRASAGWWRQRPGTARGIVFRLRIPAGAPAGNKRTRPPMDHKVTALEGEGTSAAAS